MEFNKVGPWTLCEEGCGAYRARAGKDGELIENRVAFIEKTPRIRIRDMGPGNQRNGRDNDFLNWASGPFKGDGPDDQESRDWCDQALVLFGYKL